MTVQGHSGVVIILTTPLQATVHVKTAVGSATTTGDRNNSTLLAANLINVLYHMPLEGADAVQPTGDL